MTQQYNRQSSGFTIVELMIAMAFIALLLLAIAATVMQVGGIYNKGVTMQSVNQSGRAIVTDMKRTIGESQPFDTTTKYRPQGDPRSAEGYTGGRLCTGVYTYVWNIGKNIKRTNPADPFSPLDPASQANKYDGTDSQKMVRLVKVRDNGGQYCLGDAQGPITTAGAVELLSEGNLAVQNFSIERVTTNMASGTALYSVRVTISNADTEAISTVDNQCKPPSEDITLQNYCAVNEFEFTARAGNKGGQQ